MFHIWSISAAKLQIKYEKERFVVFQCVSQAVISQESMGWQYLLA